MAVQIQQFFLTQNTNEEPLNSRYMFGAHFVANQLVGLLGARFFTNQLVGLFIASTPAKLGTPWCLDCLSLHHQLSWGLSVRILRARSDLAMSHRCAISLLHAVRIRVLILGSMSGVLIRT